MATVNKYVVAPPTPLGLCLATTVVGSYQLIPGGRKLIVTALQKLVEAEKAPSEVLILLTDLTSPKEVRTLLRTLANKGTRLNWCTGPKPDRVKNVCHRISTANVFPGESLIGSFTEQYFPKKTPFILEDFKKENRDLLDYLRYKISLSFMCSLSSAPLCSAVDKLASVYGKQKKSSFSLSLLTAKERSSVSNFRQADFPYLEGKSSAIVALKERIATVGKSDMGVLIVGETGTGKESVAFYLHEFSNRSSQPFLSINCAGLDETFLRSELFGHEQGAFTGATTAKIGLVEEAAGGTLFLDELPDLAPSLQADLLRFLQTKRYRPLGSTEVKQADLRIVAAAQPGLVSRLRPDLYYRIAEVTVETPSLNQIPNDIMRVVSHLVFRFAQMSGERMAVGEVLDYFRQGEDVLRLHNWRGNVRQLAGLVKRRLLLGDDVLAELAMSANTYPLASQLQECPTTKETENIRPIDDVVRDYVRSIHERFPHLSKQALAKILGKSVNTIRKYLNDVTE